MVELSYEEAHYILGIVFGVILGVMGNLFAELFILKMEIVRYIDMQINVLLIVTFLVMIYIVYVAWSMGKNQI